MKGQRVDGSRLPKVGACYGEPGGALARCGQATSFLILTQLFNWWRDGSIVWARLVEVKFSQ